MAAALDDTIPCEHCNTQIDIQEWSRHLRQCITDKKRPTQNTETDDMEESTTDGIPCEYCHTQISLNDWESHSKQCADSHNRRVEKLKNGIDEETTTELIPCEYCNEPIDIQDWELHSTRCANSSKRGANNRENDTNELMDAVIPCEFCGSQVSIDDWNGHMKKCADLHKKRVAKIMKRNENDPNYNLIPCEYCDKSFTLEFYEDHQTECRRKQFAADFQSGGAGGAGFGGIFPVPPHWDPSPYNVTRHTLTADTEEYKFAAGKFHETLPNNQIVQIERIQNRRWYRQYDAHRDDFIERYGKSTEQWLFHGCKSTSIEAIINDCFNRSHAVRCAVGQGIYFATQAATSLSYTQPDANNLRNMFMARVLVGKTTTGSQATRICPPGYDTTGGGGVFVTYHDAQAYGEYLITFR